MNRYLVLCTLFATIGSGLMAGLFYSFSNVVMGALRLVLVVAALVGGAGTGSSSALGGGLVYLVGVIGVTITRNVPLNDRLAAVDASGPEGAAVWDDYLRRWTLWNHVRTVGALVSFGLFVLAVI